MVPSSKRALILECLLIFGGVPIVLSLLKPHGWMYVALWIAAALSYRSLKRHGYNLKADWNKSAFTRANITPILKRFIPFAIALLLFTWAMTPAHLFSLPLERPGVWVMVMILYPLLSVMPQEIIFRSFFFQRYAPLLRDRTQTIILSAVAFGWVHVLMQNWIAITFSAIGGLLFGSTYNKTRSLALTCFEHALYGCYVFTIGLGLYFYHGQAVK